MATPSKTRDRSRIDIAGASATGPRPDNQDRWFARPRLAVLSDGMGGYTGGAVAAETPIAAAVAAAGEGAGASEPMLRTMFTAANDGVRVARASSPELDRMGATLTVAGQVDDDPRRWLVASAGDSPAFVV